MSLKLDRNKLHALIKKLHPETGEAICKDLDGYIDGETDDLTPELRGLFVMLEKECEGDSDNMGEVLDRLTKGAGDGNNS